MIPDSVRLCTQCGKRKLEPTDIAWCKHCKTNERGRNKRRKQNKELKSDAMSLFGIKRREDV